MLKRATLWAWIAFLGIFIVFLWAPTGERFPAALLSSFTFAAVLSSAPRCRPKVHIPLCPWNWALMVFFAQLTGLPLLVTLAGPKEGTLPYLPSTFAINIAMVVNCVAFLSFAWMYSTCSARSNTEDFPSLSRSVGREDVQGFVTARTTWVFAILGIIGLFLTFGDLAGIWNYFNDPGLTSQDALDLSSTWRGLGGVLLKPFLGFAVVMVWCRWLDRGGKKRSWWLRSLVALLVAGAVALSYSTFSHNRGQFVVPLVGLVAVAFAQRDKATVRFLALVGVLLLALMPVYAVYRSEKLLGEDVLTRPELRDLLMSKVDISEVVQTYGGAPQFLGYLLEKSHWGAQPHWGRMTVSSILSPLPILGKPFRATGGTAFYNELIYGTREIQDQIIPLQGETFLDFHIVGVIAAYGLLGWLAFRLQRAFEGSQSSLEIYIWQYVSVWTFFLIFGSAAVVSQIWIYFFWPIYAYFCLKRSRPVRALSVANAAYGMR
jgi:hypothetical protein